MRNENQIIFEESDNSNDFSDFDSGFDTISKPMISESGSYSTDGVPSSSSLPTSTVKQFERKVRPKCGSFHKRQVYINKHF